MSVRTQHYSMASHRTTCRNDYLTHIKERTINAGKMFSKFTPITSSIAEHSTLSCIKKQKPKDTTTYDSIDALLSCAHNISELDNMLSPEQCGFVKHYIQNNAVLYCTPRADSRATVSLALVNRQSGLLKKYANKLPIMTINVARLLYTIEAFFYTVSDDPEKRNECSRHALEFYISTDLTDNYDDDDNDTESLAMRHMPANQQFSNFLHRLRSNGYLRYIFALAAKLNFNVDFVSSQNPRVVTRYMRTNYNNTKQFNVDVRQHSSVGDYNFRRQPQLRHAKSKPTLVGIGYLTVVQQNENRWYVKTTKTPIVNSPQQQYPCTTEFE